MSLLACLGSDAEPVRDIYLARLQASTEVYLLLSHCFDFLYVFSCPVIQHSAAIMNFPEKDFFTLDETIETTTHTLIFSTHLINWFITIIIVIYCRV